MKSSVFIWLVWFLIVSPSYSVASPLGDAIRQVDEALVLVHTRCAFTVKFKNGDRPPVEVERYGVGNGFFIDTPATTPETHQLVTAGHAVSCGKEFLGDFPSAEMESFNVKAIPLIYYDAWRPITVVKNHFAERVYDLALLEVVLPKEMHPQHIPILDPNDLYDVGSRVMIRGVMFQQGKPIVRLREAVIEWIGQSQLQLSLPSYRGMSGSPVLFWWREKYYAIGVLSQQLYDPEYGILDVSFATRLQRALVAPSLTRDPVALLPSEGTMSLTSPGSKAVEN